MDTPYVNDLGGGSVRTDYAFLSRARAVEMFGSVDGALEFLRSLCNLPYRLDIDGATVGALLGLARHGLVRLALFHVGLYRTLIFNIDVDSVLQSVLGSHTLQALLVDDPTLSATVPELIESVRRRCFPGIASLAVAESERVASRYDYELLYPVCKLVGSGAALLCRVIDDADAAVRAETGELPTQGLLTFAVAVVLADCCLQRLLVINKSELARAPSDVSSCFFARLAHAIYSGRLVVGG